MKKPILFFSIFVLFISVACGMTTNFGFQTITGSGDITTEIRQVSNFENVDICCGMELYLTQGEPESLEIEADDNFMDEIVTTVLSGKLDIKYKRTSNINYLPTQPVRVYLTMVDVQGVSLSGGGYFETDSISSAVFNLDMSGGSDARIARLVSGNINVKISGGGELKADEVIGDQVLMDFSGGSDAEILALMAEELHIDVSGGGITKISGRVIDQDVSLSGGSSYKAGDLRSEHTSFSSSGGGDSTVWVTETMTVQLSGGSNLAYYGQPQIFNPSLSGDSQLDPLGERE